VPKPAHAYEPDAGVDLSELASFESGREISSKTGNMTWPFVQEYALGMVTFQEHLSIHPGGNR
jgi:hypothetical protein